MIKTFQKERSALIELLAAVLLIALGVNFVSSTAADWLAPWWEATIGIAMLIVGILLLITARGFKPTWETEFRGLIIPDKDGTNFVDIEDYELSEAAARYQRSAFAENSALARLWENEPPSKIWNYDKSTTSAPSRNLNLSSVSLIHELLEYTVLSALSTHISDYFNQLDIDDSELRTYERRDIPDILLSNRYLELFSRPMEEREGFRTPKAGKNVKVVMQGGAGGAYYSAFSLVLPRRSQVRRVGRGAITIDSPDLTLNITLTYEGMSGHIPVEFAKFYVQRDWREMRSWDVRCRISARMKWRAYFRRGGWEYYGWIESLVERIRDLVDFEAFLTRINWPTVAAVIRASSTDGNGSKASTPGLN